MKTLPKIFFLGLLLAFASHDVYADTCFDLEKNKENQIKRLETAKTKIFEQDSASLKTIKDKQLEKVSAIREKTASRVLELETISKDLQALPNQSEALQATISTLAENISIYKEETENSLASFASSTDKILEDKSKAIKNVVEQYEISVTQLYDQALASCKKTGTYNERSFDQEIKSAQKRVLDAEKNSKRILQGMDSLYATLSLNLDASDTSLNLVLKTIRTSLLENPPEDLKPLSLFRLWRML